MTRRGFLSALGGAGLFAAGAALGPRIAEHVSSGTASGMREASGTFPFQGAHQSGILTPQQAHTYFAALDLTTDKRDDVIGLLKAWTDAAAKMTGRNGVARESSDVSGLASAHLTLTFGFGPGLFVKEGKDRYGLASRRPEALFELPKFNGDQLVEGKSGGDISVQACADDPQVAFQAIRELVRLTGYSAQIRWTQTGFISRPTEGGTPRNLQGFKDGTQNPKEKEMEGFVWVGSEGPEWLRGGSYLVVRKIRMALEHWDKAETEFQEQVIGRYKSSGAPLGMKSEFDALDLNATDKDGNFIIPENAHVRLAAAQTNGGAQILRRGYSYNDGVNFVAERWPPWRQGIEYDAGLLFICYQRDPRTGFIKIFDSMSKMDALNQFVTHTGSGIFACPAGIKDNEFLGQRLFAVA